MNDWAMIAVIWVAFIAFVVMAITPTKYGIWSKYDVTMGWDNSYVLRQWFYVFGFSWTVAWVGAGAPVNKWWRYDKGNSIPVTPARAMWLDNKLAEWKRFNG